MAARIGKAAFTRADMVELIGAQLPVDVPGDPWELIDVSDWWPRSSYRCRLAQNGQNFWIHAQGHGIDSIDVVSY